MVILWFYYHELATQIALGGPWGDTYTSVGYLLLFVLFPMNVYYNSLVASEILFTTEFLLILAIYLANGRLMYVWIGVLTGLIAMIKPFFPAFALAVFLIEWVSEREFWGSLQKAGIVFFITFLVLTPWLYRN